MRDDGDRQPATGPEKLTLDETVGLGAGSPPSACSYVPIWGGRCRPLLQVVMLCEAWCTKGPKESEGEKFSCMACGLTCFLYPCFEATVHLANVGFEPGVLVVKRCQ